MAPGLSLELLVRLVDKSLVAVTESAAGRTRYRLLETVREFALERLVDAGEVNAARERHLRHFARFAVSVPRDGWPSTAALRVVNELHDDYENVRSAYVAFQVVVTCSDAARAAASVAECDSRVGMLSTGQPVVLEGQS